MRRRSRKTSLSERWWDVRHWERRILLCECTLCGVWRHHVLGLHQTGCVEVAGVAHESVAVKWAMMMYDCRSAYVMEAKKMHLCNIPKERPSVDREMNRCVCVEYRVLVHYTNMASSGFSSGDGSSFASGKTGVSSRRRPCGKCASRSAAPWRRYSPTTIAGIPINEDPLLSSLDSSSYITKAVDPAHRHWYAVAIDKLYAVSK